MKDEKSIQNTSISIIIRKNNEVIGRFSIVSILSGFISRLILSTRKSLK